jgi:hypothetical protein
VGPLQGANVGELIGLVINGWVSERFGYRWTAIVSLMLINAWTALFFTAQNVQTLLAAEILCGIVRKPPSRLAAPEQDSPPLLTLTQSHGVFSKPSPSLTPLRSAPSPCEAT